MFLLQSLRGEWLGLSTSARASARAPSDDGGRSFLGGMGAEQMRLTLPALPTGDRAVRKMPYTSRVWPDARDRVEGTGSVAAVDAWQRDVALCARCERAGEVESGQPIPDLSSAAVVDVESEGQRILRTRSRANATDDNGRHYPPSREHT
jgi:hypothetical protein